MFIYTVLQVSSKVVLEAEVDHEHPLMDQEVVDSGKRDIIYTETWELSTRELTIRAYSIVDIHCQSL